MRLNYQIKEFFNLVVHNLYFNANNRSDISVFLYCSNIINSQTNLFLISIKYFQTFAKKKKKNVINAFSVILIN